jgi:hypothetical protein
VTSARAKEEWKSNGYKKNMRRGAREEQKESERTAVAARGRRRGGEDRE